jgi:DNA-binding response OmpR family regulator
MRQKSILIAEDSEDSVLLIKKAIQEDFLLTFANSVADFTRLLTTQTFDLFLLDITLPDGTGFELCEKIKANPVWSQAPILFLSGLGDEKDKIKGFDLGADDYITKPFNLAELKARVRVRLKSNDPNQNQGNVETYGQILIQPQAHRVYVGKADPANEITLTNKEYKILLLLCKSPEQVFSREQLLNHVWPESTHVLNRTVDSHLSKLRKKLGDAGQQIEAIHGVGFRFVLKG